MHAYCVERLGLSDAAAWKRLQVARCGERRFLEFDHVIQIARGGTSNVQQVRLLCRTHNQFEAERVFGKEFMEAKREDSTPQVASALRGLGMRADEARRAAELSSRDTAIEERIRIGLRSLRVQGVKVTAGCMNGSIARERPFRPYGARLASA